MHLVSLVLLVRMSMPEKYRSMVTGVLGEQLQFHFYHRWFDVIFLVSALGSILVLYLSHKQLALLLRRHERLAVTAALPNDALHDS